MPISRRKLKANIFRLGCLLTRSLITPAKMSMTATATTIVRSKQISVTGQPLRPDGTAKLVGLATFNSGPLRKEVMRIVLNVRVE